MNTMRAVAFATCLSLLGGCATLPPEEDPVFLKLNDLEARLLRIERVVENQSLLELVTMVEQLQAQTQQLRGEIETLGFEAEKSQERQKDLYVDIDQRLEKLESVSARLPVPSGAAGDSVMAGGSLPSGQLLVPGGTDRDNYQAAFDILKEGRYEEAAAAFKQFLVVFPDSAVSDNAQYWLAETYYVQQQFAEALPAFEMVINDYPDSRKVADAWLKIGYCNYELQRFDSARTALSRVISDYPDTTAARLANQRLERMAQENS